MLLLTSPRVAATPKRGKKRKGKVLVPSSDKEDSEWEDLRAKDNEDSECVFRLIPMLHDLLNVSLPSLDGNIGNLSLKTPSKPKTPVKGKGKTPVKTPTRRTPAKSTKVQDRRVNK